MSCHRTVVEYETTGVKLILTYYQSRESTSLCTMYILATGHLLFKTYSNILIYISYRKKKPYLYYYIDRDTYLLPRSNKKMKREMLLVMSFSCYSKILISIIIYICTINLIILCKVQH